MNDFVIQTDGLTKRYGRSATVRRDRNPRATRRSTETASGPSAGFASPRNVVGGKVASTSSHGAMPFAMSANARA